MPRLRNWCFTINNYGDSDIERLDNIQCPYIVWGYEKGKKEETPHIQGYVEFDKAKTFLTVKKLLGDKAHLEGRKGTAKQASKYCMKDGHFIQKGVLSTDRQGARVDLDYVRTNALTEGMRHVTSFYNAQQIRVAEKFLTYNEEPRKWKPTVKVYWGESGTGKSKRCRDDEEDEDIYVKNDGTMWWDGYDAHEVVIIDDFRGSWWKLTEMLSLLDRYEKRVQFKGGYRQFKPRRIYITSNTHPEKWYLGCEHNAVEQLIRRIDVIKEIKSEA